MGFEALVGRPHPIFAVSKLSSFRCDTNTLAPGHYCKKLWLRRRGPGATRARAASRKEVAIATRSGEAQVPTLRRARDALGVGPTAREFRQEFTRARSGGDLQERCSVLWKDRERAQCRGPIRAEVSATSRIWAGDFGWAVSPDRGLVENCQSPGMTSPLP